MIKNLCIFKYFTLEMKICFYINSNKIQKNLNLKTVVS